MSIAQGITKKLAEARTLFSRVGAGPMATALRGRITAGAGRIAALYRSGTRGRIIVIGSAVMIIAGMGAGLALMTRSYLLHASVRQAVMVIPENAVYCLEVSDPAKVKKNFDDSAIGTAVKTSPTWEAFMNTPEMTRLFNILYYIQVKAGMSLELDTVTAFIEGPLAVAAMPDGSHLLVTRTNLKTKFGVALLTAMKGETVTIPPIEKTKTKEPKQQSDSDENRSNRKPVGEKSYQSLFNEERISLANITVSRIVISEGDVFITILKDYLFIADSLNTLKDSLRLASSPSGASLANLAGMNAALKQMKNAEAPVLLYIDARHSAASPLLTSLTGRRGLAAVIATHHAKPIAAEIYAVGTDYPADSKKEASGPEWQRRLPGDAMALFYSRTTGAADLAASLSDLEGDWKEFGGAMRTFLEKASVKITDRAGEHKGFFIRADSFESADKKPYPEFSFGYAAAAEDPALFRGLFKSKAEDRVTFQGVSYAARRQSPGQHYTPGYLYRDRIMTVSSSRQTLESLIAASLGNKPTLADIASYRALGEAAAAPHHLIVNIPAAVKGIREFLYYGADKSKGYSRATVDRDIMPLFAPLEKYALLHLAFGLPRAHSGSLVLVEAR